VHIFSFLSYSPKTTHKKNIDALMPTFLPFNMPHAHVLPELLPHQRAVGEVHLIAPEDETNDLFKNNDWTCSSCSSTQDDDATDVEKDSKFFYRAVTALQDAGSVVACVASSVIQREAASVNQKLLRVQDRLHRQKRRRLSAISSDSRSEEPDRTTFPSLKQDKKTETVLPTPTIAVSEQESVSIWNQAARTKRMSILLRDLEMTHCLLLREIAAASVASSSTNIS
jgi:hypothetical protein